MIRTPINRLCKTCIFITLLSFALLFSCCENERIDPADTQIANKLFKSFKIQENNEVVEVISYDGYLIISFEKADFYLLKEEYDFSRKISINIQEFSCQFDEKFSDKLWTIEPGNITFKNPVALRIQYTHEEFAPDFDVKNLKIYQLKRDYIPQDYDKLDPRMFRLSDMKILEPSEHHENELVVITRIDQLGSFVIGRKMNIKGEIF